MYYRDSCSAAAQAIVTALRSARRVQPGADAISVLSTLVARLLAAAGTGKRDRFIHDHGSVWTMVTPLTDDGGWQTVYISSTYSCKSACLVTCLVVRVVVTTPSCVAYRSATAVHDPAVGGRSVLIQCVLYVVMANAAPHRALRLYLSTWGSPCRVALALCAWP